MNGFESIDWVNKFIESEYSCDCLDEHFFYYQIQVEKGMVNMVWFNSSIDKSILMVD